MNLFVVQARSIARKTGLTRLINLFRSHAVYEERFHKALMDGVKPGDVVWDVGANVGLYTELFCAWVGVTGAVVAFEPALDACDSIRQRVGECGWLQIEQLALGETDTIGQFVIEDVSSVNNHIQTEANPADVGRETVPVVISRADTVQARLGRTPNKVKVDVEGFEEEVLAGFGDLLSSPELRGLFVEVHFQKLEARGRAAAPVRIERLLKSKGFTTTWPDSSHLVAER